MLRIATSETQSKIMWVVKGALKTKLPRPHSEVITVFTAALRFSGISTAPPALEFFPSPSCLGTRSLKSCPPLATHGAFAGRAASPRWWRSSVLRGLGSGQGGQAGTWVPSLQVGRAKLPAAKSQHLGPTAGHGLFPRVTGHVPCSPESMDGLIINEGVTARGTWLGWREA